MKCEACGIEKIGGVCLTRWCENRDESVDRVLGKGKKLAHCQSPSCRKIIYENDDYVKTHNGAMHEGCAYE